MSFAPRDLTPEERAQLRAAEEPGGSFLVYRDGEGQQQLRGLDGERLSIGRDAGNDLPLGWDRETSRLHALLEQLGGSWTVVDDGISRNGTLVNGARVRGRRRLNDRDLIRVGSTQILYRDPMQAADETPAAAGSATVAGLTAAQRRVLLALCRPLLEATEVAVTPPSNGEIAAELTVSVEAVRTQMKTLFKLFEVPDLPQNRKRADLARRALASGIVLPRDL
jgi:pSer/pThr/pTyr-binding forkhead associated (FHA) protein